MLQSYGAINPTRYVSGGPSNRITDVLVGTHYTCGPVTYRVSYSAGFDDNPGGHQNLWVPGATVALPRKSPFAPRKGASFRGAKGDTS